MRKSVKKQQSQVQTIQRIVTCRNITQDNGNVKDFWKGSRWFCCHCLKTFYFLWPESRNGCLENYICVQAFKHIPLPIDQVFCTHCMLCLYLLHSRWFQLTVLPKQTMQWVQHTIDYFSHVFFQMCTHALTQMRKCV